MQAGFKSLQRDKTEGGVRSEGGEVSDDGEDIGSAAAAYGALNATDEKEFSAKVSFKP
jgi:hypothetical protein